MHEDISEAIFGILSTKKLPEKLFKDFFITFLKKSLEKFKSFKNCTKPFINSLIEVAIKLWILAAAVTKSEKKIKQSNGIVTWFQKLRDELWGGGSEDLRCVTEDLREFQGISEDYQCISEAFHGASRPFLVGSVGSKSVAEAFFFRALEYFRCVTEGPM